MNLKQTIKVLEEHNRWRRDNNVPAKTKMAEPKVLGMALDRAIEELKNLLIQRASHCTCTPDETTGTTSVKCCNICGKPAESFCLSEQLCECKCEYPIIRTGVTEYCSICQLEVK